jgi:AcrR family transcriptional regulator
MFDSRTALGEPGGTRAARHEATKERILDAAWRIARRDGLGAISLRELAADVGMRAPSLYTYFPSKSHIYDAMYRQGLEQYAEAQLRVPDSSDPEEMVRRRARIFVKLGCEDPARYQLIFQRPIPGFVPSDVSFQIGVRTWSVISADLERAGLRTEQAVAMWRSVTNGMIGMQIANDPSGTSWVDHVDHAVDMVLAYHRRETTRERGDKDEQRHRGRKRTNRDGKRNPVRSGRS